MGALLLLGGVVWSVLRAGSVPPRMAVGLLGVENDPLAHLPRVPGVLNGATGLSAFFVVTNVGKDAGIWFDTCALEQKVGGGMAANARVTVHRAPHCPIGRRAKTMACDRQ